MQRTSSFNNCVPKPTAANLCPERFFSVMLQSDAREISAHNFRARS